MRQAVHLRTGRYGTHLRATARLRQRLTPPEPHAMPPAQRDACAGMRMRAPRRGCTGRVAMARRLNLMERVCEMADASRPYLRLLRKPTDDRARHTTATGAAEPISAAAPAPGTRCFEIGLALG